jgi:phage terminase large subunit-like protein
MQPFEIINILKKVASEFVKSDCKNSMLKDVDKYASEYEDKILFGVKAGDGSLDKSLFEYIYNQINNKNEVQDKLYNPKFATKIPSKLDRLKIEIDILRDNNTKLKEENKYFEVVNKRLKKQLEMIIFITTGQLE